MPVTIPNNFIADFNKSNKSFKGKDGVERVRAGLWQWRNADGNVVALTARWDDKVGVEKKIILPYSLKNGKISFGLFSETRPLWRLPELVKTELPILIVEGEKCASYCKKHASGYFVTTWIGGTGGVNKTNFEIIRGREIFIMPDNDDNGIKAANQIAKITGGRVLPALSSMEKGADFADCTPDEVMQWLSDNVSAPPPPARILPANINRKIIEHSDIEIKCSRGQTPDAPLSATMAVLAQYEVDGMLKISRDMFRKGEISVEKTTKFVDKEFIDMMRNDYEIAITMLSTMIYRTHSFEPSANVTMKAVDSISKINSFHPIQDYLESVKWDGVARVKNLLSDYFNTDKNELSQASSVLLMLNAVKRIYLPNHKYDIMIVLESGRQGLGKSEGIKKLFGADYTNTASLSKIDGRDMLEQTNGFWCIEYAELEGLNRSDFARVKAMLSASADTARRAYARKEQTVNRQWVSIGTTNKYYWLSDISGGRRFLPFRVHDYIDHDKISADRDQLWAEAMMMYRNNHDSSLSPHLYKVAEAEQRKRFVGAPLSIPIQDVLASNDRNNGLAFEKYITVSDVFNSIGIPIAQRSIPLQNQITDELQFRGYENMGDGRFLNPNPDVKEPIKPPTIIDSEMPF